MRGKVVLRLVLKRSWHLLIPTKMDMAMEQTKAAKML